MRAWNDLEGIDLPEWARFVATDLGGFRYCYPERPVAGDRIWHRGGDPLKHIDTVNLGGIDWRHTLIDLEEYRASTTAPPAGTKHDAGKVQPTLVLDGFARALHAVSEVATHGAEKYGPGNWQLVEDGIKRYSDARDRHRLARAMGEERDPESGLLHAAHEAWNALAVLELMLRDCS